MWEHCRIVSVVLAAAGCALSEDSPADHRPTVSIVPVTEGGIVAAEAWGRIACPWEDAAGRLVSWEPLVRAQRETLSVLTLPSGTAAASQLEAPAEKAGVDPRSLVENLASWQAGEAEKSHEGATILGQIRKHKGMGARLAAPPARGTPRGKLGVSVFGSTDDVYLALAEVRAERSDTEAVLLEIHFFVSRSYAAGVNVYHIVQEDGDHLRLTVQLYSWVREAEGFGGGVARLIAGGKLQTQAAATWHEVAAYVRGL